MTHKGFSLFVLAGPLWWREQGVLGEAGTARGAMGHCPGATREAGTAGQGPTAGLCHCRTLLTACFIPLNLHVIPLEAACHAHDTKGA